MVETTLHLQTLRGSAAKHSLYIVLVRSVQVEGPSFCGEAKTDTLFGIFWPFQRAVVLLAHSSARCQVYNTSSYSVALVGEVLHRRSGENEVSFLPAAILAACKRKRGNKIILRFCSHQNSKAKTTTHLIAIMLGNVCYWFCTLFYEIAAFYFRRNLSFSFSRHYL